MIILWGEDSPQKVVTIEKYNTSRPKGMVLWKDTYVLQYFNFQMRTLGQVGLRILLRSHPALAASELKTILLNSICVVNKNTVHAVLIRQIRHRGPSSYTVALIGFATRRSLPAKFHINKKIWRPKNSTTLRNRKSNSLFLTVEFFLLRFFSGWTFVGKLQVPTKLPKVFLLFNNINTVKGY